MECPSEVTTIATVVSSLLLILSEVLPYTASVKGNGIVEVLATSLLRYIKKTKNTPEEGESLV